MTSTGFVAAQDGQYDEIATIVKEITQHATGDSAILETIYSWITGNISYDIAAKRRTRINRSVGDVLNRRRAVCLGFSQLVAAMCQSAGLEAYVISGYSLRDRHDLAEAPDHAWNAVLVDGRWALLDATWGATPGVPEYGGAFTAIESFNQEHYPAFPGWQLKDCPELLQPNSDSCGYVDSLTAYLNSTPLEQRETESRMAYLQHPTMANRKAWAHALIDQAVYEQGLGDTSSTDTLHYSRAIALFEQAQELDQSWYDWQKESYAFTLMHQARNTYNMLPAGSETKGQLEEIQSNLSHAALLLETVTSSVQAEEARESCREIISRLQVELDAFRK